MTSHFISDLHLSPQTPKLVEGFKNFVNRIPLSDTLYILGDFFDAWIGDDEDTPTYTDIQQFLKEKTSAGLRIYFMKGNRDFAIGKQFAKNTGVTLLNDPTLLRLHGKSILLMHGDSLCTQDKSYMRFRAIIRHPLVLFILLILPLGLRRLIANKLRGKSQIANSDKPMEIMDVNQQEVERVLNESGADILLHGHTHRPARHSLCDKERIVLGDWHNTGWTLAINDDEIELKEFEL